MVLRGGIWSHLLVTGVFVIRLDFLRSYANQQFGFLLDLSDGRENTLGRGGNYTYGTSSGMNFTNLGLGRLYTNSGFGFRSD